MNKLRVSRELTHLAAEEGARACIKSYVEGTFANQFPGWTVDIDMVNFTLDSVTTALNIEGFEIEWVD